MNDIAISVKNVSKNFRYTSGRAGTIKSIFTGIFKSKKTKDKDIQYALKNVSFDIKVGEFFGIVGRNGSGKSTLLKMIAGIYQPNEGSILVSGKLVPFIELGVGFNPELTGRENVYLNGALLGFSKKEIDRQFSDIVAFAELEKFMDQQLKNYSSGMQVRLAFSMAVRAKADILLIDEVLAVGDANFQRKCFDYFKQLKKNKKTVVFVSHDMSAVREYCDRAALVDDSVLVGVGTANDISQRYTKLFAQAGATTLNDQNNRWGAGNIITDKINVEANAQTITIKQTVKFNDNDNSVIAGFRIKDAAGNEISGTNTRIEAYDLPEVKQDEKIEINWLLPNVLSDGVYTIDPAIIRSDGVTVEDWWDEACSLKISKNRHVPYPIDLGCKISVKKIEK